uniref:Uncharacterized protein n=1 Tax=Arundo donax TaxID=35708 RepID=A0A0A9B464_ARUDO
MFDALNCAIESYYFITSRTSTYCISSGFQIL